MRSIRRPRRFRSVRPAEQSCLILLRAVGQRVGQFASKIPAIRARRSRGNARFLADAAEWRAVISRGARESSPRFHGVES